VRWPSAWELVSWSIELIVRQSPASKDVNMEAEKATALSRYQATTGEDTAD
jgi:hypothetical protein